MKQLSAWSVLGFWALFCVGGTLFATSQGYGGRAFAATCACFAFVLLVMLLLAAKGVAERLTAKLGAASGVLLGVCLLLSYIGYLMGTSALLWTRVAEMAGLIFVPMALAVWAGTAAPGVWQDFVSVVGIWVFVKFGPRAWMWPYPAGKLSHVLTSVVAVDVALASFLLIRRAKGIGYSIGWGKNWTLYVAGSFLAFACIAIPLGTAIHFIRWGPQWSHLGDYAGISLAILMFTAWPEELLFRGLLQNFLARASKSEFAGWWTASVLFGLSHITNLGFPNWRYVILATIAGLFYGWTWRKTGSIFGSALVHGAVDSVWHFLFRTL
ncbi:MAG TPA: type II CAAX endopeptidase family protein [Candidatus Sulfotelmatobacter sp.]|nr:type II CAAX endopeptidase family protein [Candidatus Sulfotelmatobacter sp.]